MRIFFLLLTLTWANSVGAQNPTPNASSGLFQIMMALGLVIIVLLAMAWLMKRVGSHIGINRIPVKMLGGLSLGQRERIVVVEVANQCLVLGVTAQQISLLTQIDGEALNESDAASDDTSKPTTRPHGFTDWLKASLEKRQTPPTD